MSRKQFRSLVALPALFAAASLHAAPVTLTHSASMTTTHGAIYCGNLNVSATNSWGRTFNLASFGINGAFDVQSVTFGVGLAQSSAGQQAVSVKIYDGYNLSGAPNFPTRGKLVGSFTQQIANGANFNLTWNVPATIMTGLMYVEVESVNPDPFLQNGMIFTVGANSAGQTAPWYLVAPSCGANNPIPNFAIGYPNDHMVLSVTGMEASVIPSPLSGALGVVGLSGIVASRRRR